MLQRNEIRESMEGPEINAASAEAAEALNIEEVLRRAREIHRRHGGFFGYDFEDWDQAWSELAAGNRKTNVTLGREMESATAANDIREVSHPCFPYDN